MVMIGIAVNSWSFKEEGSLRERIVLGVIGLLSYYIPIFTLMIIKFPHALFIRIAQAHRSNVSELQILEMIIVVGVGVGCCFSARMVFRARERRALEAQRQASDPAYRKWSQHPRWKELQQFVTAEGWQLRMTDNNIFMIRDTRREQYADVDAILADIHAGKFR
jgi:hypothetical protein